MRETNKFDKYYLDSEWADDNQFLRGEINLRRGDYTEAANEFQQVITNYPDTDLYDTVIAKQYEIGDKLYESGLERKGKRFRPFKKKPFKQAIEVYRMVIANQPFTLAAAEAPGACMLSIDSEGTDGTTLVAGGLTDSRTYAASIEQGSHIRQALKQHATHEALSALGDCINCR